MGTTVSASKQRLPGLDFARFLAFAGMVYVNFHVVTGMGEGAPLAQGFLMILEGKAAATFVVLAGIGLGFGAARATGKSFNSTILKRALFLFVIGLLNSLIFPADILHYYAIYFVFGLMLIRLKTSVLIGVAVFLPILFLFLTEIFDYGMGWNWLTFEYTGFWTPTGFVSNLLFNGWHPVVPWFSFLLFGILLSRTDLSSSRMQNWLIYGGGVALAIAYGLSAIFTPMLIGDDVLIVSISPVPPMPLYMLAGSGAAALVLGVCLKIVPKLDVGFLGPFLQTGKQALTLYIAHIIVGMGILEAFDMIGGQSAEISIFAANLFIIFAVVYAVIWGRFFKTGPIEGLMRRLAG